MSGFTEQSAGQYIVVDNPEMDPSQLSGRVELFREDGTPYVIGGGLSMQTSTFTVPNEWILAHPRVNPDARESYELIPDTPGEMVCLFGGFVTLRFASQPYEGYLQTSIHVMYGTDPGLALIPFTALVDSGFWEATEDATLRLLPDLNGGNIQQIPGTYPSVSFFLDSPNPELDPLIAGDSDLEVTLYYMIFNL